MRTIAPALIAVLWMCSGSLHAGEYSHAQVKGTSLTFSSTRQGQITAPRTAGEQQAGFTDVRISDDGNTVGWVTLERSTASYPYPVTLVLFRGGKVIRQFQDWGILTEWHFLGNDAVAVRREFPHGSRFMGFFQLRISDGASLAKYECGERYPTGEKLDPEAVPAWAAPMAGECPAR